MSLDEQTPVADEPLVAELDLGEPGDEAPSAGAAGAAGAPGAPAVARRHRWGGRWARSWPMVAAGLAGALVGGGLVQAVGRAADRGATDLTVALGPSGGQLLTRQFGSLRILRLSTVAVNSSPGVVTLRGVRVEGDGARLTRSYRGEVSIYPFELQPGETGNMPIVLASDCAVRSPTPPRVTVDVTAEDGTQRTVEVRIPGLDELWRRATTPDACSGS